MSELDLAGDFPAADEAQWLGLVEKVLGGRDFKRTLVTETLDGLPIDPLYRQTDPGRRVGVGGPGWTVFQRVDHPDVDEANRLAIADLEGGAAGLEIQFPGSVRSNGFGVHVNSLDDFDRLLNGIDLTATPLRIDAGYEIRNALVFVAALIDRRGIDPAEVDIVGLSDPVSGLLYEGRLIADYDEIGDHGSDVVHSLFRRGLNIRAFGIDARGVHGAGGSSAQELAYALSDAVEIMRQMEKRKVPLDRFAPTLTFIVAADADQFVTMAKLRALRLLWARALELCGLPPGEPVLHAQTAWRMMTRRDPWVNILRTTVATAGAGLGGADSITVLPYTLAVGLPDAFARRVARNIQLVLLEESGLGRVSDPAAGSGYLEALTRQLCDKAWDLFQEIEGEGGLKASVCAGAFQQRVSKVQQARMADVATRRDPILGVSEYPWLKELPVKTLNPGVDAAVDAGTALVKPVSGGGEWFDAMISAVQDSASFADLAMTARSTWSRATPLRMVRLAEPFENLRDASDRALAATGRRPGVFLATIGTMADFTARAGFARNAFEAGGIEALGGSVYEDDEAIDASFAESGARLACICGTDTDYAARATSLASALKAAGADAVYLAGRPGDQAEAWQAAGIDAYIYAGCDILAELIVAHARLGLAEESLGTEEGPLL